MADPKVVFDARKIYEVTERSDIDPHQNKSTIMRELEAGGEDWGDGFIVQDEPVVVTRSKKDGRILRTTPMSEALFMEQATDDYDPVEVAPRPYNEPLSLSDREKLVSILAMRLFRWYQAQPRRPDVFNPVYDGIPEAPPGSAANLQPPTGMNLFPATQEQVFEWLKTKVIGPRAQIINKKHGKTGVARDYALRISR